MQALHATDSPSIARRGFTLVELMVSIAVLAVLVMMLTSAFNAASRAWVSGEGNSERQRSARALADFISAELQGALIPVEAKSVADGGNLQFVINPTTGGMDQYSNADSIFWQAPLATESSYGDVAEVGYFVKWDMNAGMTPKPVLCRFFVNPSIRDTTGALIPNPYFRIYDQDASAWLTSELVEELAPATKNRGYAGLFAENVVGLWITAYGLDGEEIEKPFDSRIGYTNTFRVGERTWTEQRYLPAKVQVSLAQIDSNHANRLAPVWEVVRDLTNSESVHNAADFVEQLRLKANTTPALGALLPGIRIYSTEVYLENGR